MPTSHRAVDTGGVSLLYQSSTSAERVAADRRRGNAKALDGVFPFYSRGEGFRYVPRLARVRNPKPWVLAAFFGHFLSLETESTPPEAYRVARGAVCGGTHGPCRGVRYNRRTGSSVPTDDMRVCASPGRRGEGAPPYGVQQEVQWFGSSRTPPPTSGLQAVQGRDDGGIVPYGRG